MISEKKQKRTPTFKSSETRDWFPVSEAIQGRSFALFLYTIFQLTV
jgi:hypothetical protein